MIYIKIQTRQLLQQIQCQQNNSRNLEGLGKESANVRSGHYTIAVSAHDVW